jgi:hypothetical protein
LPVTAHDDKPGRQERLLLGMGVMRSLRLLASLAASLSIVACGGGSSPATPTSPTPAPSQTPAPPPTASGATINGQLSTGATGASTAPGLASSRATTVASVSVVGTGISGTADGAGRFTLPNVPAGTVQLRFTGPGTDATVSVTDLRTGDTIAITVAVNGAHATLLGDSRNPAQSSHTPINGVITSLSGTLDAFEIVVNGERIRGDAVTEFYGHPNRTPAEVFSRMNGLRAEVKAWPRTGFWYAERLHINFDEPPPTTTTPPTDTTPPGQQDTSASIEGRLTAIGGARPALTLTIAGTTVRTDGSTVVQRRGDTQDLSVLRTGMTIHVVGDRRSDGSIDARRLQITDDDTGGAFEIEGSVGGLKGTCPAVSFGVNGFNVVATAATTFTPACSELRSGNKVRVQGVTQADGTVRATSVTR